MKREQIEKEAKRRTNKFEVPDNNLIASENGFIAGAEWALSHQWVSVEDVLPEYEQQVVIKTKENCHYVARYNYHFMDFMMRNEAIANVTHWMPIPPLTEEGGEK